MNKYVEQLLNNVSPYQMQKSVKTDFLLDGLKYLTNTHKELCAEYARITQHIDTQDIHSLADVPYLPVRLFKMMELKSIDKEQVFRVMTSSGTSGQAVSKIFLDRDTASLQSKVLSKIVTSFIGKKRMPMMVVDENDILKGNKKFSARAAGVIGFSSFGKKQTFALDDKLVANHEVIKEFTEEYKDQDILMFGFTFVVWKSFIKPLLTNNKDINFNNRATLVHGGGWKKLQNESVSNKKFKDSASELGINKVHDYYGMIEQTGSVFMECEEGHLHCSDYSDVLVRDLKTHEVCPFNKMGILQVISLLPHSYPGHSLLTEDTGTILGEDDCACGRPGKYFVVHGRMQSAEVRGCSDTRAI